MLEVEVVCADGAFDDGATERSLPQRDSEAAPSDAPPLAEVERLCVLAAASAGIEDGHLAIEYVDEERIAQLNAEHRGKEGPTDVLSFPVDGADQHGGAAPHDGVVPSDTGTLRGGVPRELGDVLICPAHTTDLREAIVHGVLHLVGMDHETDSGEMLALQAELLADRRSR
jgi:probable rRNA maturation factor